MESNSRAGMAATTKDVHVPDEARRCWDTFSNGKQVDEEPEVDSDSDFEQVAEEEQNAGVAASVSGGKMATAAHARVEDQSSGAAAARDGDEEEVSEDGNVQTQVRYLVGRKRKAVVTRSKLETIGTEIHDKNGQEERISEDNHIKVGGGLQGWKRVITATPCKLQTATGTEIQNMKGQGECLRVENEMLRLQLVHKTKELETEQIRRLSLELQLKNLEIMSLKKQNEALRAENEHYRKTAKPSRNPRLCRFCNEYVVGHDYRNCPKRRASASSEQDEDDDFPANTHEAMLC
uniref:Uncharacterized protein n=1 Tax=Avena sativa TaxID=4498 RepID=A0ACD5U6K8_AVESA